MQRVKGARANGIEQRYHASKSDDNTRTVN